MYRNGMDAFCFQIPVYVSVRDFITEFGIKSVLDVGCGNPQKLKAYVYPFVGDIVGWDLPDVVVRIAGSFGKWIEVDLDIDSIDMKRTFELIVAADVIEHLKNPANMLDAIKRHADESTIILISTPEKSSLGVGPGGRPLNPDHNKEYTRGEIAKILEDNGLCVEWTKPYVEIHTNPRYINNVFLCKKMKGESNG